jgi:hypothetical protein
MQRTIGCPPFPSSDLDVNPTINVVIAYEDFEAGKYAKNTYDFLVERLGSECQFANQMWKFDVLGIPKLREMAAKDAATADIIIISCHGGDLSNQVKAWIELWLSEEIHPIALVALFGRESSDAEHTKAVRSYLTSVARRGRMEFFAQPDEWPGHEPAEEPFAFRRYPESATPVPNLADALTHDKRFPRWGINE